MQHGTWLRCGPARSRVRWRAGCALLAAKTCWAQQRLPACCWHLSVSLRAAACMLICNSAAAWPFNLQAARCSSPAAAPFSPSRARTAAPTTPPRRESRTPCAAACAAQDARRTPLRRQPCLDARHLPKACPCAALCTHLTCSAARALPPPCSNNAYVFPAVGHAAVLAQSREISDEVFLVTAETLASMTSLEVGEAAYRRWASCPAAACARPWSTVSGAGAARWREAHALPCHALPPALVCSTCPLLPAAGPPECSLTSLSW